MAVVSAHPTVATMAAPSTPPSLSASSVNYPLAALPLAALATTNQRRHSKWTSARPTSQTLWKISNFIHDHLTSPIRNDSHLLLPLTAANH